MPSDAAQDASPPNPPATTRNTSPDAPRDTIPAPAEPVTPGMPLAPRPKPIIPPILIDRDLPGPLSLKRLTILGSVGGLDSRSGYWIEHADTLYGRAMITERIIPFATIACAFTALWVWMGGTFPDTLDVMSRSHFRKTHHGRRVRAFDRKVEHRDLARIGPLRVTRPARTVCDIVTIFGDRTEDMLLIEPIADCMDVYDFSPGDCMTILDENPCMPTVPQARTLLRSVSRIYAQRRAGNNSAPSSEEAKNEISPA